MFFGLRMRSTAAPFSEGMSSRDLQVGRRQFLIARGALILRYRKWERPQGYPAAANHGLSTVHSQATPRLDLFQRWTHGFPNPRKIRTKGKRSRTGTSYSSARFGISGSGNKLPS